MIKQIKFRGKTEDGDYVYGGINDTGTCIINRFQFIPVQPETVKQFVGYDKNKKELYEGDKITDKYGYTLTAKLCPQAAYNNGQLRINWEPDSYNFQASSEESDS